MTNYIEHDGMVETVDDKTVFVRISRSSACHHCSAGNLCGMNDASEKVLEIPVHASTLKPGDKVTVGIPQKSAMSAIVVAFILPSILLLTAIFVFNSMDVSDLESAALSLGIVAVYMLFLSFFRKLLKQKFVLKIFPRSAD
jgi:sigma-E factor negative regulatory protein RseC